MSVPQRRIKTYLALASSFLVIFLITVGACLGVYYFLRLRPAVVVSPIALLAHQKDPSSALNEIKDDCQILHMSCLDPIILPDGNIHFTTDTNAEVFLSTQKDLKKQLASLQAVIDALTIKGKKLKRIDFRFINVVVGF